MIGRHHLAALVLLLLALPAQGAPQPPPRSRLAPADLASLGFHQRPGAALPLDVTLRDEDGATVPLRRFFHGVPVLVVLEYLHCPGLCGLVLGGLAQSLEKLSLKAGRDFEILAVSIDPRETPADAVAARASYRARYPSAGDFSGWHFLTAGGETIAQLAAAIGFPYRYDPAIGQYAHPAGLTVATGDGIISSYILGVDYQPVELKLGIIGAGSGTIAAPVSRLLLLCYGYDPQSGRYTSLIERTVEIAWLATVLLVASAVGLALWRERKRRSVGR